MEKEKSVYLANNFGAQAEMRDLRERLKMYGIKVTSTWIDIQPDDPIREDKLKCCNNDLHDLFWADALIYFAEPHQDNPGLGKHVELGYALGLDKPIYIVRGPNQRDSVFYHSVIVRQFDNLDVLITHLVENGVGG